MPDSLNKVITQLEQLDSILSGPKSPSIQQDKINDNLKIAISVLNSCQHRKALDAIGRIKHASKRLKDAVADSKRYRNAVEKIKANLGGKCDGLTDGMSACNNNEAAENISESGRRVQYGSTELSRVVQKMRLATHDRSHNYAAALLDDGEIVVGVSNRDMHAEMRLLSQLKGRAIVSIYTEREPCSNRCLPALKGQNISDITWSVPWNPGSVRAESNITLVKEVRKIFDGNT